MRRNLRLIRTSAIAMIVRGLWPSRNPLRRATDKAETVLVAGLIAAFLVGAPAASVGAAHWAAAAGQRAEQVTRYKVEAVLLQDTPGPYYTLYGPVAMPALAMWTAPDGSARAGLIKATYGGHAGAKVSIWTNKSGEPIGPPPRRGQVSTQEALAAASAFVLTGLVLLVAGMVALGAVNRRRLAAWDTAWQVTGPRWTSRR
jgi:hypothetical protein